MPRLHVGSLAERPQYLLISSERTKRLASIVVQVRIDASFSCLKWEHHVAPALLFFGCDVSEYILYGGTSFLPKAHP